ncbi:hypothetical protein GCM10025865_24580 [Paraoerskovia sediminicola]|uniref:Uncharacterized protein n=1 Tax=Paraoerskovia sediminicola TaxID=1138587 RepID=A0ABM8G4W8_9CELL|nr:hypothetical protein [Paraoerskovia sediminicola]BDZ43159.1 hypothetical protein GCM10025865_24580 [Paraoerskovia sediminicola]
MGVLASTMRSAGIAGLDDLESKALPPRRITGTAEDASYLCIPTDLRAPELMHPHR